MLIARSALVALLVTGLAGGAAANGRDPFISSIHFRPGDGQKIQAGATFGLIRSEDGGATWRWYCERAIGYGGTYDPDYAYTDTGALFATTFDGLKVMRDDCTFGATPPGMTFVTHVARSSTGTLLFSASAQTDTKIYRSTDDGVTFPTSTTPDANGDAWWQTLEFAPSDPQRVYLTGYRLPKKCTSNSQNPGTMCGSNADCPESAPDAGACEAQKEFLLFRSTNGGADFVPMTSSGISPTSLNSALEIAGIDPVDPDIVYLRVTLETNTSGESIYRSNDAGATWTKILTRNSNLGGLAFLVRSDRSCVAGTRDIGAWKAPFVSAGPNSGCGTDGSGAWTELTTAPHIGCLVENSAGEVWACTQNTESVQLGITSDGFGMMKSTDLATWTGVMRFQEIAAPVACAAGTVQQDRCIDRFNDEQSAWCCLVPQLGITSTAIACVGYMACFGTRDESPPDGTVKPPSEGCCDSKGSPGSPAVLSLLVGAALLLRSRRSKER
jgi:hypothetical protein